MAIRPELLIVDEPFAELDRAGMERITTCLNALAETTIVWSSPLLPPKALESRVYSLA